MNKLLIQLNKNSATKNKPFNLVDGEIHYLNIPVWTKKQHEKLMASNEELSDIALAFQVITANLLLITRDIQIASDNIVEALSKENTESSTKPSRTLKKISKR